MSKIADMRLLEDMFAAGMPRAVYHGKDDFLSAVARALEVSKSQVNLWLAQGAIKKIKVADCYMVIRCGKHVGVVVRSKRVG